MNPPPGREPAITNRRDMRKALVRLHMETHREALRREAELMLNPMQRVHDASDNVAQRLKSISTPVWVGGAALLLGLVTRRKRRGGGGGGRLSQLIRLGVLLAPVAKMAYQHRTDATPDRSPGRGRPMDWRGGRPTTAPASSLPRDPA